MSIEAPKKGFTLIELMLYVAIVSVLLSTVVGLYMALAQSRTKMQAVSEVEMQGYHAMAQVTAAIRGGQSISSPTPGNASGSLTLVTGATSTNPTIIDVMSSTLRIKEGTSNPIALTNSRVQVSNLVFENFTNPGTEGSIFVYFTLSNVNLTGRYDSTYSAIFYGAATIRRISQ